MLAAGSLALSTKPRVEPDPLSSAAPSGPVLKSLSRPAPVCRLAPLASPRHLQRLASSKTTTRSLESQAPDAFRNQSLYQLPHCSREAKWQRSPSSKLCRGLNTAALCTLVAGAPGSCCLHRPLGLLLCTSTSLPHPHCLPRANHEQEKDPSQALKHTKISTGHKGRTKGTEMEVGPGRPGV